MEAGGELLDRGLLFGAVSENAECGYASVRGDRLVGADCQRQEQRLLLAVLRNEADAVCNGIARAGHAETQLLKCHEFVPGLEAAIAAGQLAVVYVYRDVRDVVASICTKYGSPAFGFVGGGIATLLRESAQWTSVPGIHVACYEAMVTDVPLEVRRLASNHLAVTPKHGRNSELPMALPSYIRQVPQPAQHDPSRLDGCRLRAEPRQSLGDHVGVDERVDADGFLQQVRRSGRLPRSVRTGDDDDLREERSVRDDVHVGESRRTTPPPL